MYKKCPVLSQSACQKSVFLHPHYPRHFLYFHKSAWKKCSLYPHYPRQFKYFQEKLPGKKISLPPHYPRHYLHYPRHFQYFHKSAWKKCSLHPHVPRHILYFQKKCLVKSVICLRTYPGTKHFFCSYWPSTLHLWRKKCLGEKKCLGTRFPGSRILRRPASHEILHIMLCRSSHSVHRGGQVQRLDSTAVRPDCSLSLQNVSQWERLGSINRTPGIPGSRPA